MHNILFHSFFFCFWGRRKECTVWNGIEKRLVFIRQKKIIFFYLFILTFTRSHTINSSYCMLFIFPFVVSLFYFHHLNKNCGNNWNLQLILSINSIHSSNLQLQWAYQQEDEAVPSWFFLFLFLFLRISPPPWSQYVPIFALSTTWLQ